MHRMLLYLMTMTLWHATKDRSTQLPHIIVTQATHLGWSGAVRHTHEVAFSIGRSVFPHTQTLDPAAMQPYAAPVFCVIVRPRNTWTRVTTYVFADPAGMEGWAGLLGLPIAESLRRKWPYICQTLIRRRPGKVRRSKTDVLTTTLHRQWTWETVSQLLTSVDRWRHCLRRLQKVTFTQQ